MLPRR